MEIFIFIPVILSRKMSDKNAINLTKQLFPE